MTVLGWLAIIFLVMVAAVIYICMPEKRRKRK